MRTAVLFLLLASVSAASAQTTGRLEGTVQDGTGASVPMAQLRVINTEAGQVFETTTNESGRWVVPALPTGFYQVQVTKQGFKSATIEKVKIDAGLPSTVNVTLEIGSLAETIEVQGGVEVLQTATATVAATLVGRQLNELPFTSRNLTELLATQAGFAVPNIPRNMSANGMPQSTLNITLDGLNIQDNLNKSSDLYTPVFARADAIEEMTVTTAAAGADNTGEGAAQVRMVTRRGTNNWNGSVFWQHRNDFFNANYYFNNIDGLPRDRIKLNQIGGRIGGPIWKDKLFFFAHYEAFRLPQSYNSPTQTILTPEARQGLFSYRDTASGAIRTVNLYQLAAAKNPTLPANVRPYPTTPDPVVARTLDQISAITGTAGSKFSRIDTNNDYNRLNYNFQTPGKNNRDFPTLRLDWNVSSKHQLEFVYNYPKNLRSPDGLNTAIPILPGTGIVLNGQAIGSQGGNNFSAVVAVRSALTPRLTSEIRFGLTGGTVIFNDGVSPADFAQWNGYATAYGYLTNPYRVTGQSRRNTPVKQGQANLTYSWGSHLLNFGGSFTQVNAWSSANTGSAFVPVASFGIAANDPINLGATNLFDLVNFPNSNPADRTNAAAQYALLTGRISQIARSVNLDENTRKYGVFPPVTRNRQREFALYLQDTWRIAPSLTFNFGLRLDRQNPPENLNGIYTRPGFEGVWGISGVGNLFRPGVLTGKVPVYNPVEAGASAFNGFNYWAPSAGLAWVLPKSEFAPLRWLAGSGQSVLRMGYAISTIREGASTLNDVWNSNQGRVFTTTIDPNNFPTEFGPAGSVHFRDPNLPARVAPSEPNFPIPVLAGNTVRDFDPNLRVGYVQSWNFGFQRELTRDTVLELRYVGNHGTRLWKEVNVNEVNIFENGFLDEFRVAQSNLSIARQSNAASNNFGNQNLPGQRAIPIIQTALGTTNDVNFALQIARGQAGTVAASIAQNAQRMGRLTAAGYPQNLFIANPTVVGGASTYMTNAGHSTYNALQVELRRRLSNGLLAQGSYTWSKSLTNTFDEGIGGSFTTFRNPGLDKFVSPWDIRHQFKANWIYELPFGPRRKFLNGVENVVVRKALEGWDLAGVTRFQSGSPVLLTGGGRNTFNNLDAGVALFNMTAKDLQNMVEIRKTTSATNLRGIVYFLPQSLIDNSMAAFEVGNKTLANLDRSKPYIGPATVPGQLGYRVSLYGPWQQKWDFSLLKKTQITERTNVEFRAQFLNIFNLQNFLLGPAGNAVTSLSVGNDFGQTRSAYRDLNNTNDPGSRVIEFVLRLNF